MIPPTDTDTSNILLRSLVFAPSDSPAAGTVQVSWLWAVETVAAAHSKELQDGHPFSLIETEMPEVPDGPKFDPAMVVS